MQLKLPLTIQTEMTYYTGIIYVLVDGNDFDVCYVNRLEDAEQILHFFNNSLRLFCPSNLIRGLRNLDTNSVVMN